MEVFIMAFDTDIKLQNQVIYSVYVRNHTPEGTARRLGVYSMLDVDGYAAFDIEYDYDTREAMDKFLAGKATLSHWLDFVNYQEGAYPANYNKLRCLENHDQPRIASFVSDMAALESYTAMVYFLKGTTLIYAGQEYANTHLPSLFEKEPIDRATGRDLSPLMRRLYTIKHEYFGSVDWFWCKTDDETSLAICERGGNGRRFVGIFPLCAKAQECAVDVPDGEYEDLIHGGTVAAREGKLHCTGAPVIFQVE